MVGLNSGPLECGVSSFLIFHNLQSSLPHLECPGLVSSGDSTKFILEEFLSCFRMVHQRIFTSFVTVNVINQVLNKYSRPKYESNKDQNHGHSSGTVGRSHPLLWQVASMVHKG